MEEGTSLPLHCPSANEDGARPGADCREGATEELLGAKALPVYAATATLTQNIIGAGVLALPFAFRSAGLLGGLALLLLVYALSIFTMGQLVMLAGETGVASFKGIAEQALGGRWPICTELWVLFYSLGICVAYPILMGDFLSDLAQYFGKGTSVPKKVWMAGTTALICWPLSCARSLGGLRWISVVGIVGIGLTVIAAFERYLDGSYSSPMRNNMSLFEASTFGDCFPILVGAFGAHYNVPALYQEVAVGLPRRVAHRRMMWAIYGAVTVSALVYGSVGLVVYANFGASTTSDFTQNFRPDDAWLVVVRLTMTLALCASFPLTMVSARNAAFGILLQPRGWSMTPAVRCCVTTALVVFCLCLAVAAGDIGVVLSYNGSVFGTPVCYMAPGVMYLKLLPSSGSLPGWRGPSLAVVLLGGAFGLLGVVMVSLRPK